MSTQAWNEFVSKFGQVIGVDPKAIETALASLIGNPGDEALALLQSEEDTPFEDIRTLLPQVPIGRLRKAVRSIRIAEVPVANGADGQLANLFGAAGENLLPDVPDDESWLKSLQVGGKLKVDQGAVKQGIRALVAVKSGLFDLPGRLRTAMDHQANSIEEPIGVEFHEVEDLLAKRRFAKALNAIPGFSRRHVTDERRRTLITKLEVSLWPALKEFNQALEAWAKRLQESYSTPMMMVSILRGGGGTQLPMATPDTTSVRDAAEAAINKVNKCFAGYGFLVAAAMGQEAKEIQKILDLNTLPVLVGAVNRETMLKKLGVSVDSDVPRLEQNLVRYSLGMFELLKISVDQEIGYLFSLYMLGGTIPWEKFSTITSSNISRQGTAKSRSGIHVSDVENDDEEGDDFEEEDDDFEEEPVSSSNSRTGRWDS